MRKFERNLAQFLQSDGFWFYLMHIKSLNRCRLISRSHPTSIPVKFSRIWIMNFQELKPVAVPSLAARWHQLRRLPADEIFRPIHCRFQLLLQLSSTENTVSLFFCFVFVHFFRVCISLYFIWNEESAATKKNSPRGDKHQGAKVVKSLNEGLALSRW